MPTKKTADEPTPRRICVKSFLYFLCILSSAYTIATPATLANQEPFFSESTITSTVTVQISSIDEFIDTIDENWYGGVYVKNDIYHILALPEYYEALVEKVEKEYSSSKTSCVVDFPDNAVIYSRSQIKTARAILEQQKENFHIIDSERSNVGFSGVGTIQKFI